MKKIKCILCNSLHNKFYIRIYDQCNNLICQNCTNNKGELNLINFGKGLYYIEAYPIYNNIICNYYKRCKILIRSNEDLTYPIYFNLYSSNNNKKQRFCIIDKNYKNLCIEKGIIKLNNKYEVNIENGECISSVPNGEYNITCNVPGYDASSINPATQLIEEGVTEYAFTVGATGTLTIHVSEDGTAEGTPVVGATFSRCDVIGTEYGDPVMTDEAGNAVFNNVPFKDPSGEIEPIPVYYKESNSDGAHHFDATVQMVSLQTDNEIVELPNALSVDLTFKLTDANYADMPIPNGTVNIEN